MIAQHRLVFVLFVVALLVQSSFSCSADQMLNVVLFGATGATGKAFVDLLRGGRHAAKYVSHPAALPAETEAPAGGRHLTAFTRRAALWPVVENAPHPFGEFVLDNQVVDFEDQEGTLAPKLAELQEQHGPIDVVFCAHGTTKAAAGTDEAFIHMDQEMVVEMARIAKAAGVKHFSLVSSAMVSTDSMFLYPRTKAQTIEMIKALGFERFSVFKPGMLIPSEPRPDTRMAEHLAISVSPFLSWVSRATGFESFKILQSIEVEDLAAAMIANAMRPSPTPGTSYEEYETAPDIIALKHNPKV